ncbi:MAG: hypothetical protein WDZ35_16180 [Crocinitomicaceae bacterium]
MLKINTTFIGNFLDNNYYTVMKSQLQLIADASLGVFYPNHCGICSSDLGMNEHHVCLSCLYDLPYLYKRKDQVESLQQLFWGRANVEKTYALFNYQKGNQVQDILHLIKYKQKKNWRSISVKNLLKRFLLKNKLTISFPCLCILKN